MCTPLPNCPLQQHRFTCFLIAEGARCSSFKSARKKKHYLEKFTPFIILINHLVLDIGHYKEIQINLDDVEAFANSTYDDNHVAEVALSKEISGFVIRCNLIHQRNMNWPVG